MKTIEVRNRLPLLDILPPIGNTEKLSIIKQLASDNNQISFSNEEG